VPGSRHYRKQAAREAELWGVAKSDIPLTWFDSPTIARHINLQTTGRPDRDWLDLVADHYLAKDPAPLGLNVGCGHGELERHFLERDLVTRMHGFDISESAVEHARQNGVDAGLADRVDYFVADANQLDGSAIDKDYDFVVASMALHHFSDLESCLDALRDRMRPGGLFVANEFIGATRFQFSDAQLDAVNRFLGCIPSDLRRDLRNPSERKDRVYRPSVSFMEQNFGFEAICSDRIVPAIEERFEVLEFRGYGGTVLHLLFEAIMGNFDESRVREHAVIVRLAVEFERSLIECGALDHDHALIVARKPA
jgi:SAM-dependent methyltransferase